MHTPGKRPTAATKQVTASPYTSSISTHLGRRLPFLRLLLLGRRGLGLLLGRRLAGLALALAACLLLLPRADQVDLKVRVGGRLCRRRKDQGSSACEGGPWGSNCLVPRSRILFVLRFAACHPPLHVRMSLGTPRQAYLVLLLHLPV